MSGIHHFLLLKSSVHSEFVISMFRDQNFAFDYECLDLFKRFAHVERIPYSRAEIKAHSRSMPIAQYPCTLNLRSANRTESYFINPWYRIINIGSYPTKLNKNYSLLTSKAKTVKLVSKWLLAVAIP